MIVFLDKNIFANLVSCPLFILKGLVYKFKTDVYKFKTFNTLNGGSNFENN